MPGMARTARKSKTPGSNGSRYGRFSVRAVDDTAAAAGAWWCRAVARSAEGVMAKTSPMVSLNWRTLLKPAAKAMSATFMVVETSRVRAVWARLARASDSGPAPSSWLRIRLSCREE